MSHLPTPAAARHVRRALHAIVLVVLVSCATDPPAGSPADDDVRWLFVRDAHDRAILAVEAESDGSFELDLQGAWKVTVTGPYSVTVAGAGRMNVRDRSFAWNGTELTDRVTGKVATRTKATFVRRDGAVFEDLPFR